MRRALVTGGTRGIGLAIAESLHARGHEVTVTYAHDDAAAEALRASRPFSVVKCDVADENAVDALFAAERQRGFEILVHAAGFTRDKLMMMMPPGDWDAVTGVHLRGGFLVARQAMKAMIAARWGRLIFVASPTAQRGRPGQTAYGAAKAGLGGLMRSLAHEVARWQITVNCVSAGLVETAMTAELASEIRAELVAKTALGRMGRAEEVAAVVSWLTSDGAGYITGQTIAADGGLT